MIKVDGRGDQGRFVMNEQGEFKVDPRHHEEGSLSHFWF